MKYSKLLICDEEADIRKLLLRRNNGKRFGIDRENRFFHIEITFPNLRYPQLFIKEEVLKLKDGILFANLKIIMQICFIVTKRQSCSPSVNNAKKHERQGDVKLR